MRAGPGGSGTSDGGGRPAAGAPGPRTQAGCPVQEDRRPLPRDCEYAHRPPRAGRDRAWAPRGSAGAPTVLGQRPGGGPLEPPPGLWAASWDCFLPLLLRAWTSWRGRWPRHFPQRPGRAVAAAEGKFTGVPGGETRLMPCLGEDGQSPSVHPGRGSLSGAPRPPQERETLGRAHFTAESTEGPEAPCVVCGAPIPRGTHARGTRRLRQAGRGHPQAPGPGLPVCPPVHCGPLSPKWALP